MQFFGWDQELLLIFLMFIGGMYLMRRHLQSLQHQVMGYYLPEWAISVLISLLLSLSLWLVLHLLLWIFA